MLPREYPMNVPAAMVAFFVCPATFEVPMAMHWTQAEEKKLMR